MSDIDQSKVTVSDLDLDLKIEEDIGKVSGEPNSKGNNLSRNDEDGDDDDKDNESNSSGDNKRNNNESSGSNGVKENEDKMKPSKSENKENSNGNTPTTGDGEKKKRKRKRKKKGGGNGKENGNRGEAGATSEDAAGCQVNDEEDVRMEAGENGNNGTAGITEKEGEKEEVEAKGSRKEKELRKERFDSESSTENGDDAKSDQGQEDIENGNVGVEKVADDGKEVHDDVSISQSVSEASGRKKEETGENSDETIHDEGKAKKKNKRKNKRSHNNHNNNHKHNQNNNENDGSGGHPTGQTPEKVDDIRCVDNNSNTNNKTAVETVKKCEELDSPCIPEDGNVDKDEGEEEKGGAKGGKNLETMPDFKGDNVDCITNKANGNSKNDDMEVDKHVVDPNFGVDKCEVDNSTSNEESVHVLLETPTIQTMSPTEDDVDKEKVESERKHGCDVISSHVTTSPQTSGQNISADNAIEVGVKNHVNVVEQTTADDTSVADTTQHDTHCQDHATLDDVQVLNQPGSDDLDMGLAKQQIETDNQNHSKSEFSDEIMKTENNFEALLNEETIQKQQQNQNQTDHQDGFVHQVEVVLNEETIQTPQNHQDESRKPIEVVPNDETIQKKEPTVWSHSGTIERIALDETLEKMRQLNLSPKKMISDCDQQSSLYNGNAEMESNNVQSNTDISSEVDSMESEDTKIQTDRLTSSTDTLHCKDTLVKMEDKAVMTSHTSILHDQELKEQVEAMARLQEHAHQQQVEANLATTSLRAKLRKRDHELKTLRAQHEQQMSAVVSHLLYLEGQMQREHREIFEVLQEKDDVIRRQRAAIEDLSLKNEKLLLALKESHGYTVQNGHISQGQGNISIQDHGNKVILRQTKGRNYEKEKPSKESHKVRFSSMKERLRRHKSSLELYKSEPLETLVEGSLRYYGSEENLVEQDELGQPRALDRKERCKSLVDYPFGLGEVKECAGESPDSCFSDDYSSSPSHSQRNSMSSSMSSLPNGVGSGYVNGGDRSRWGRLISPSSPYSLTSSSSGISSSTSSPSHSVSSSSYSTSSPYYQGFNELSKSRSVPHALPTVTESDSGASSLKERPHSLPSVELLAKDNVLPEQGYTGPRSRSGSTSSNSSLSLPASNSSPPQSESNPFKSFKNVFKRKGSKKKRSVALGQNSNKEFSNEMKEHFKKYDLT